MKPVEVVIVGADSRGTGYAEFAKHHPDRMRVVGVAEPREFYRERMAQEYDIPAANVATDWQELTARDRFADAAIIATGDAHHEEPAIAFANRKYAMLLEKPMAPTEDACRRIVGAAKEHGIIFAVCHVLRYTNFTKQLKAMVDTGLIGDVVSIQHLEGVGYWHQAHSFVRGNWRNEKESSFMLLAKSCHDLDWIRHIMGHRCLRISSFGSLKHFRREDQPAVATDRCVTCGVEPDCPYSAKKIYMGFFEEGRRGWPLNVLAPDVTKKSILEAIETGPYGQCVYACDNDVVDNQVVSMEFEGGRSASFTMTAFAKGGRKTTVFGTRGELICNEHTIIHNDFLRDTTSELDTRQTSSGALAGHGGGDYGIMDSFIGAVADRNPSRILSGPDETLETHRMVFAAERARHNGTVEAI